MTVTIPKPMSTAVSALKVDGDNPNRMTAKQHERLCTSIKKYGFIVPIITNKDYLVADGEQRLIVARDLGMTHVPVIRLDVDDVDRRLLRQVLNKLRGEHDLIADAYEFERIISAGHEDELKHLLDLSDSQLERYLTEIREPKDEDYEIPEINKIKTDIQRGDVYVLRNHRLMCGDATSHGDVQQLMNGEKADMIYTDPPYNVHVNYGKKGTEQLVNDNLSPNEYKQFCDAFFTNMYNVAKVGCPVYVWSGWWFYEVLKKAFEYSKFHFSQPIIWDKKQFVLAHGYDYHRQFEHGFYGWKGKKTDRYFHPDVHNARDIWTVQKDFTGHYLHPTQKPVELALIPIYNSSNNPDIILDLFGGSGSTLIASEQTGRTCYMMEIDPRYCQVIVDRWQSYTNEKAVKLN